MMSRSSGGWVVNTGPTRAEQLRTDARAARDRAEAAAVKAEAAADRSEAAAREAAKPWWKKIL